VTGTLGSASAATSSWHTAGGGPADSAWHEALLRPRSIAVVGASRDPRKTSGMPGRLLRRHGFEGTVHLVNPRVPEIDGQPTVASIRDLPPGVDLALLMVPDARVMSDVAACRDAGVRTAVVCAPGAPPADRDLVTGCADVSLRLLGPNSQGLVNLYDRVTATFSHSAGRADLLTGPTAVVSQSGAVAGVLWDLLHSRGIGIGYWASTGNEWDLDLADLMVAVADDERVSRIILYVEGVRRGREFLDALDRCRDRSIEVLVLKSGRSPLGAQATATHTAAAAGDYEVFLQLCRQHGAVVLGGLDDVVTACLPGPSQLRRLFRDVPVPERSGGVGVVSSSGGFGALLVDRLHEHGLRAAAFAPHTVEALSGALDPGGSPVNPVDLTARFLGTLGSAPAQVATDMVTSDLADPVARSVWSDVSEIIAADPDVAVVVAVVSMVTGRSGDALARELRALSQSLDTPLAVVWLGGDLTEPFRRLLAEEGVAVAPSVDILVSGLEDAASPLSAASRAPRPVGSTTPAESATTEVSYVGDLEALTLLESAGVPLPRWVPASSPAEAERAAATWGSEVVLKGVARAVAHKTAAGLVRLGIQPNAVTTAYEQIQAAAAAGGRTLTCVLVQEQVDHDVEMLVGLRRDPAFGPVVVLGEGGTSAGSGTSVSISTLPTSYAEALAAVRSAVARGDLPDLPPNSQRPLAEFVGVIAGVFLRSPWLGELEINPVVFRRDRANGQGVVALDCLACLS
jgi:acetate---CoA ligase (ADP-forming)